MPSKKSPVSKKVTKAKAVKKPTPAPKKTPGKKPVAVSPKKSPVKAKAPVPTKVASPKAAPMPVAKEKKEKASTVMVTPTRKVTTGSVKVSLPIQPTLVNNDRYFFSPEMDDVEIPELLEIQRESFNWFLDEGIRELIDEVSPINDFSGKKIDLHFLSHGFDAPLYTVEQAKRKNLNYESPLKCHVQMTNKETGEIKEQDVYLGAIPLMTDKGSFVINGIERVIVNQIVRSPGVFFSNSAAAPGMFSAKIIPKRGAWLEIETDKKGVIWVKIDRKRKVPITSLLRVFGFPKDKDIIGLFSDVTKDITENSILLTLEKDPAKTAEEAAQAIYKRLRPGDLATASSAKSVIENLFFDFKKYDMGQVARYKINARFGIDRPFDRKHTVFQADDLVLILKHLIRLNEGEGEADDIDHLANRRIRSVGELIQNKMRIGFLRMERIAKDRMTVVDLESVTPTQLINSRPITAALKEFFSSSQLSQFMDQTNPLSELEHKRRISAMGPGGLSRERASFEVRDVHSSHFGRICPIASPEGPNIGLVVHMASYAKVNKYGFIETPYRSVEQQVKNTVKDLTYRMSRNGGIVDEKGKEIVPPDSLITPALAEKVAKLVKGGTVPVRAFLGQKVAYYDAEEERTLIIAEANSQIDEHGNFVQTRISARQNSEPILAHVNDLTHVDVSPKQILSIGTAMIPFVEHDDSTRASMGTNMQRQAVPILKPEAPIVGTGIEHTAALNSGYLLIADENGEVVDVDASHITMLYDSGKKTRHKLLNYERSNQGTVIHQRPIVSKGDRKKKGDYLVDAQCIDKGELSLGKNLLVAYMPWYGYNFEDAIVVSEKVFQGDFYSSIHIEDFSVDVRDTKLGAEIITRDIPNVSETKLKDLDEDGIIRIGATVNEGDILVGKITPKGEAELTVEERLLQAIFGEKAKDVKDTSLRLPGGEGGKVVDVQILTRENSDELPTGVLKQIKVFVAQTRKIEVGDKMAGRHGNKGIISTIVPVENMPFLEDGTPVDIVLNPLGVVSRMNIGQILEAHLGLAAKKLGIRVATPVLNGIHPDQIKTFMKATGIPVDGKVQLYNGFTGEAFEEKTMVGVTYMLKLHHLVEDKIHARSVGPYSLVTQQPLGGKAQHGGQRFGEMEVWALQAYGAAYTLQEMLTIKSDDVRGRSRAYESIVKADAIRAPEIPESFNVLVKELQSLGLRVDLFTREELAEIRMITEDLDLAGVVVDAGEDDEHAVRVEEADTVAAEEPDKDVEEPSDAFEPDETEERSAKDNEPVSLEEMAIKEGQASDDQEDE